MDVGTAVATAGSGGQNVQGTAATFTLVPSTMTNITLSGDAPMWWQFNGAAVASGAGVAPVIELRVVVDGVAGPARVLSVNSGYNMISADFLLRGTAGNHTGYVEWRRATGARIARLFNGHMTAVGLQGAQGATGPAGPGFVSFGAGATPVVLAPSSPTGLRVLASDIVHESPNDDRGVESVEQIRRINTRNATPTVVQSWVIGSGTAEMVDVAVTALASGGSLAGAFSRAASYRNQAGTPTLFGGVDVTKTHLDAGASGLWGVTMTHTGATGLVYVFGTPTATITWGSFLRRQIQKVR